MLGKEETTVLSAAVVEKCLKTLLLKMFYQSTVMALWTEELYLKTIKVFNKIAVS